MSKEKSFQVSGALTWFFRFCLTVVFLSVFIPAINPARLSGLINRNVSLFTCATSYSTIGNNFIRALRSGWIDQSPLTFAYVGALIATLAVALIAAAICIDLGNLKMRRLSVKISCGAALVGIVGTTVLYLAYTMFADAPNPERIDPIFPIGIPVYFGLFGILLLLSVAFWLKLPKAPPEMRYALEPKYRLLLMILPFLVLVALFAYLPLLGWRYIFYDYRAGMALSKENFVGFQWFEYLINNPNTRNNIGRVIKNTFAMSGLGLMFSWLPMAFAIFLSEMRSNTSRRLVQTFTTIPNFISWVLVYSVAFAIFSTEGFYNWTLISLGVIQEGTNHLINSDHMWMKMFAYGTWKGLGWSAIIYIAGVSSIDQQLYEAATVDGAGRFSKMWHVTVPGLMSTFFVLLLLSISNILSNGLDQYLAFQNPMNKASIEVLDLYIYNLGLGATGSGASIPLATLIGMLKSVISVTLLFSVNHASKWLRGETIV